MKTTLNKFNIIPLLNQHTLLSFDEIIVTDEVTSTNNIISEQLKNSPQQNFVCIADSQTEGRGRLGRAWISPPGNNICLSFSWCFQCSLSKLSGLSLAVGLGIIRALKNCGISNDIQLKWPNDVFFKSKKLGGILIESQTQANHQCTVIVGIGLNVHHYAQMDSISQPWTTLDLITKTHNDRHPLIAALLNAQCDMMQEFESNGFSTFIEEWKKVDLLFGKNSTIKNNEKTIQGIARGVTENGALIVEQPTGESAIISCGEVFFHPWEHRREH